MTVYNERRRAILMKLSAYLVVTSSLFFVFAFMAQAERDSRLGSVKVRGTELAADLQLRLLLEKIPSTSKANFSVSGFQLRDSEGRQVPGDNLNCQRESRSWVCRSGKKYALTLDSGTRIFPEGGFIEFRGKSYRGGLELRAEKSRLLVLNVVSLEKYLVGLLTKEMSPDFPIEALKAQAVAARSYALSRTADQRMAGRSWDLVVTPDDQVYHGAHAEDPRTLTAVKATSNQALLFKGDVITAYYHASSGGQLELPENVWGKTPLLADRLTYGIQDNPWDREALKWEVTIAPIFGEMWAEIGKIKDLRILSRTEGNRVSLLQIVGELGSVVLAGTEVRKKFGSDFIKSLNFELETLKDQQGWKVRGRGWGHGVGLSQWAAKAMAESGWDYLRILKFHYPFADVKSWIPLHIPIPAVDALPAIPRALVR
jgi:stage II sporulation protein D